MRFMPRFASLVEKLCTLRDNWLAPLGQERASRRSTRRRSRPRRLALAVEPLESRELPVVNLPGGFSLPYLARLRTLPPTLSCPA